MRCEHWSPVVNRRLQAGIFLIVAAAAGFAGYTLNRAGMRPPLVETAARKLLLAPLTDLNGKAQTLSQRRGKVLVVNFWATWCPPCREEIPALMRIQRKYSVNGVEVIGIALDNESKVRDYAENMGINYNLLIGSTETLATVSDLGNATGVLPFTIVLDRAGKPAYTHAGALTEASLDVVLLPLL